MFDSLLHVACSFVINSYFSLVIFIHTYWFRADSWGLGELGQRSDPRKNSSCVYYFSVLFASSHIDLDLFHFSNYISLFDLQIGIRARLWYRIYVEGPPSYLPSTLVVKRSGPTSRATVGGVKFAPSNLSLHVLAWHTTHVLISWDFLKFLGVLARFGIFLAYLVKNLSYYSDRSCLNWSLSSSQTLQFCYYLDSWF